MKTHFISIITVNHNGKKYLEDFYTSVFRINYPRDKYEVIMVDNASSDDSVRYTRKNYPNVKIIESDVNLGFGKGNNLGIIHSSGDCVLLLNNDTMIESSALNHALSSLKKWKRKKIAVVTFKLVLYDYYLEINLTDCQFVNYQSVNGTTTKNERPYVIKYESDKSTSEKIYIPISDIDKENVVLKIQIAKEWIKTGEVGVAGKKYKIDFKNNKSQEIPVRLSRPEVSKFKVQMIQNAGNFHFRDGYGRDRGAVIRGGEQLYEVDTGQYEKEEIVPAFCGAGVLIDKKALSDVGLFDEDFFMYYEDGELSYRMKEKNWNILYCPKAVVRHIHSASSKEWSDFFIYHAERGRLLLVFKHWPRAIAVKEWVKYVFRDTILTPIYYFNKGQTKEASVRFKTRIKVNVSVTYPFISGMLRNNRLTNKDIDLML